MHPSFSLLLNSIKKSVDIEDTPFLEAHQQSPHTTIKLNNHKINDIQLLEFSIQQPVKWTENAFYLNERPTFYADPIFYAGGYYVMDASSMFLEYILKQLNISKNSCILDVAAAPGGKSVIINDYLNEDGILWSNEINFNRAKILAYNLSKWGKCNFLITNNDAAKFNNIQELFDVAVCDVPCSGSGLFRKYPDWITSFNVSLVQQCVQRQKQILKNIFSSIKATGYLIYCTCSYTSEENEEIADYIVENGFDYVEIPIPAEWGIVKSRIGLRFFPHLTDSEGFYYAVFQKKSNTSVENQHDKRTGHRPEKSEKTKHVRFIEYLNLQNYHQIYTWKNKFFLSNTAAEETFKPNFNYVSIGTCIHEKESHVPAAELAFSLHLNNTIPTLELSKKDALSFLSKASLKLSAPKGWYWITYKNLGLGWAKVLENRVNNYFPTDWRILKEIDEFHK